MFKIERKLYDKRNEIRRTCVSQIFTFANKVSYFFRSRISCAENLHRLFLSKLYISQTCIAKFVAAFYVRYFRNVVVVGDDDFSFVHFPIAENYMFGGIDVSPGQRSSNVGGINDRICVEDLVIRAAYGI